MISIQNLSVEFSAKSLFDGINYVINKRDRIALVGKNGAGKSTMLKIIAGVQKPTSGSVAVPQDVTIGYLPQHMTLTDTNTVIDEVRKAFGHIQQLHEQYDRLSAELAERTDYESDAYARLIDRMTTLSEQISMEEGDGGEAEMEKTLIGLGFVRSDFNRPTSEFSGGWRMRIELAKILLQRPDVLLLDEPTNHLDIESIQWLENFLVTKAGAVVLVSHDRAFIDNVTNRTIEISLGKIYDYAVNYSKYVVLHQERIEQQRRAYENQQKQIQDTEEFIERFRYKATKAVQVQSRMKQLAKIERIEVDEVDTSRLNLRFPPAPRSGDYQVIADNANQITGAKPTPQLAVLFPQVLVRHVQRIRQCLILLLHIAQVTPQHHLLVVAQHKQSLPAGIRRLLLQFVNQPENGQHVFSPVEYITDNDQLVFTERPFIAVVDDPVVFQDRHKTIQIPVGVGNHQYTVRLRHPPLRTLKRMQGDLKTVISFVRHHRKGKIRRQGLVRLVLQLTLQSHRHHPGGTVLPIQDIGPVGIVNLFRFLFSGGQEQQARHHLQHTWYQAYFQLKFLFSSKF